MAGSDQGDLWDRLRKRMRAGESIEMANVSTLDLLRNMAEMSHVNRRMEAQADAYLKGQCPDYEPPDPPEGDDMQVYMNNIITDRKTLKHVADAEAGKKSSALPWLLGSILTGVLAAGLTYALMPKTDDTDTQNTLRPDNPGQIITFQ